MRLAFSTNAYMKYPFEEAAARIAALGYEGLELMADVPHAWPCGAARRAEAGDPGGHGAEIALAFSNVNAFMMNAINDHRHPYLHPVVHRGRRGISPGPDRPHEARPRTLQGTGRARTSRPSRAGRSAKGQPRQAAIDLFVEGLKPLAEHAHKLGVLLLIEPEPFLLLSRRPTSISKWPSG